MFILFTKVSQVHRIVPNTQKGTTLTWWNECIVIPLSEVHGPSWPLQLAVPDQRSPRGFIHPRFGPSWEASELLGLRAPWVCHIVLNGQSLLTPPCTPSYLRAGTMPSLSSDRISTCSSLWAHTTLTCSGISSFPYLSVFYYAVLGWTALKFATRV